MAKFSMPDKLNLGQFPTPIQPLAKLSNTVSKFGEVKLFVKRAKTVVTCGSEQSNHARTTAILARELGFECVLFLKKASDGVSPIEGNLLLDHMCGATVSIISAAEYGDTGKALYGLVTELTAGLAAAVQRAER